MVLQDLNRHNLVGPLFPALGHLAEGAAAEELEDLILVVEGAVEDLVLDQLVVSIAVGAARPRPPALAPAPRLGDQELHLGLARPPLLRAAPFRLHSEEVSLLSIQHAYFPLIVNESLHISGFQQYFILRCAKLVCCLLQSKLPNVTFLLQFKIKYFCLLL